jgi:hypothetical protein
MYKTKAMKYILLMMFSVLLWSCNKNKEDDPFAGSDNYVVSFSLTSRDQTIHASISDAEIIIAKPVGYSLNGATAKVTLSENAGIQPNPAEISDWENEQVFVVTARNGQKKVYTYSVINSGATANGSIILQTQAEVDAFGVNGITEIKGSLVIGATSGRDSITSVAPLNNLKTVSYNVTIKSTYAGKTLDGLVALETIGGTLCIETSGLKEAKFSTLNSVMGGEIVSKSIVKIECPKLTHVYGDFRFSTTNLTVIDMPVLEAVDRDFSFDIPDFRNDVSSMQSLVFPALKNVGGTFYIANQANITKINLPELTTCGAMALTGSATLGTVTVSFPKLEKCKKELLYDNLPKLQEVKLPSLTQAGSFVISSCGDLESIDAPKLKEVDKDLYICPFIDMDTDGFKNLAALTSVGGLFHIKYGYDTPMKNLILPPILKSCHTLKLDDCATIESLNITGIDIKELILERGTLINLTIKGDRIFNGTLTVDAENNSSIATGSYSYAFPKFEGIEETGSLKIIPGRIPVLAIADIKKINGNFQIVNYGGITTFSVQDLTEVTGDVISRDLGLAILEFASIRKVGGNILIGGNSIYETFDGETLHFPLLTQANSLQIYVSDLST